MNVPDNYDRWEQHEAEQAKRLARLPKCDKCGEPIQQERAIYYNDQWICEDCEEDFWREIREDFLAYTDED